MEEVRLGGAAVAVLPVVRGLPSERERVAASIGAERPDVVALTVSPEELETLRTYDGGNLEPGTTEDEVYVAGLSAWEEPVMPPPCFTAAVREAVARHVPLEALDLNEEAYADAYTACVSTVEVIFQGRIENRLLKKRFHVASPAEFAIAWDAEVNRSAGFARLQRQRERFIASRLQEVAHGRARVLAVIEVERVKGVLSELGGQRPT